MTAYGVAVTMVLLLYVLGNIVAVETVKDKMDLMYKIGTVTILSLFVVHFAVIILT